MNLILCIFSESFIQTSNHRDDSLHVTMIKYD